MADPDFAFDREALSRALELMGGKSEGGEGAPSMPAEMPELGLGGQATLDFLAPAVLGKASALGDATAFAHMDPPTPWITWATTLWNASVNQNLLHPATAPTAREIEHRVIDWLTPFFGMSGGHMVPGSTIANLTALWAARECAGVKEVVYGESAHLSVGKAAHILGLAARPLPCGPSGALVPKAVPEDLRHTALVLTAGTTSTGAVDDLSLCGRAAWTHVDAAWAGPLRLSQAHAHVLSGIEGADSVAVSAHKWLFQPKESAFVLFRDAARAHDAISFGGAYLAAPNVGVLGSHGATAVPLLATLLAWGRQGTATRIDALMAAASELASLILSHDQLELLAMPQTGVVVWRPKRTDLTEPLFAAMPPGSCSVTNLGGERWLRNVAANPNFELDAFATAMEVALRGLGIR
ncbi:glutamate/tyrosine decarboxylase-like PLP-dependent enzyme [Erythromicrobium ramosum]|uniref:Aspartate aminotransferase family protein n=1 Tax=Erythrobacter ramosus TaxID=35811 RepID=A0A6I4UM76_9SPHN|nr:pyridoxal-dependent decarboxylase [Erythrobacter ramosus]MBB3777092.1 glutamate/tyrosine decarboxylase-like PLP-dependent enzyme [Erythrobacter ramosus]MXP39768.1 aspartate aminotransferase family protein [Erythrobacter ramosus]